MNGKYEADWLQIYAQPIGFANFFLMGNLSGSGVELQVFSDHWYPARTSGDHPTQRE